jgi:hypothetical protein
MANGRGSYGADASKSGSGLGAVGVLLALGVVIYGLSPGARHWYRHGRLPATEDTARWHR